MDPVDDWVDAVTHATSPPELSTVTMTDLPSIVMA